MPRERATSANARHECFVMDASVSVRTAETAEMDEIQASRWPAISRLLSTRSTRLTTRGTALTADRGQPSGSGGAVVLPVVPK
jgi:hypothetical protein